MDYISRNVDDEDKDQSNEPYTKYQSAIRYSQFNHPDQSVIEERNRLIQEKQKYDEKRNERDIISKKTTEKLVTMKLKKYGLK